MRERRQEKLGWTGGWLGGFVWVLILALVMFAQGHWGRGVLGLFIAGAACTSILAASPWRYPKTQYRVLMAPIYLLLFAAVGWGVWAFGDPRRMGINSWWTLLVLAPTLTPLWVVGRRRWEDGEV